MDLKVFDNGCSCDYYSPWIKIICLMQGYKEKVQKQNDRISDLQTLRENIHLEYREVVERRVFTVTGT